MSKKDVVLFASLTWLLLFSVKGNAADHVQTVKEDNDRSLKGKQSALDHAGDSKQNQLQSIYRKQMERPWRIGAGAIFSPNPYKNSSPTILPIPVIGYQGDRLSVFGPFASYKVFKTKVAQTAIQVFLYPQIFKADQSDDQALQKLDNRGYIAMVGINQRINSPYGSLALSANVDVTTRSNGYMATLDYEKRFFYIHQRHLWTITPSLGIQYSSYQLTDYYYGISHAESLRSGLKQYSPGGAFSPYLGLALIYSYSQRWSVMLSNRMSRLSNHVVDSPMVSERTIITSVFSLSYSF